jgi:DNA-directed RNA polymerase specialized sigma subunit
MLRGIRRRPSVADTLLNGIPGKDRMEDRILDSIILEQVFSESKKGDRRIAEMRYIEGCTLAETGKQVALSISGVVKHLQALHKLCVALLAR